MKQIKIFESESLMEIENEVNEFLQEVKVEDVLDIKHSIVAISHDNDAVKLHTVAITYKVEKLMSTPNDHRGNLKEWLSELSEEKERLEKEKNLIEGKIDKLKRRNMILSNLSGRIDSDYRALLNDLFVSKNRAAIDSLKIKHRKFEEDEYEEKINLLNYIIENIKGMIV